MTEHPYHHIDHPKAQRFDRVEARVVERWKESELSGDEWRFSFVVDLYSHGILVHSIGASSIQSALIQAVAVFDQFGPGKIVEKLAKARAERCAQPGCENPWTVLMHPIRRHDRRGNELVRPYSDDEVRGFCDRHRHRGDCGLDDADDNYTIIDLGETS